MCRTAASSAASAAPPRRTCRRSRFLSVTSVHRNPSAGWQHAGQRNAGRRYNPQVPMAIRVLMYGLGPIGAAVARQIASRKGFQIVGAVDIDRAKIGLDLGEVIGLDKKLKVRVTNDAVGAIKSGKPDVAVLCTSSSLKKVMPQIESGAQEEGRDRLDDRGAVVSGRQEPRAGEEDRCARQEGQGRRRRHRRQSRLRDGRAADHADRHLRARRQHPRRSHPGRAHAPPAVPAEDRLRPQQGAVRAEGQGRQRPSRRPGRERDDDRRRDGLEARQGHRRDPAEDRRQGRRERAASPSIPATSAASSRTASAT